MKFENPEMKVVLFNVEDILTVSGEVDSSEDTVDTSMPDCPVRLPDIPIF